MSVDRIEIKNYCSKDKAKIFHFVKSSNRRFNLADMPTSAKEISKGNLIKFVFRNPNFKPEKNVYEAWRGNELLGIMFLRINNKQGELPVFMIKEYQLDRVGSLLLTKAEEVFSAAEIKDISIGCGVPRYPLVSWLMLLHRR
ncbi:hypothetical protein J7K43_01975 [Candidatus Calescamantes bacterium]|nr:hypothetical protein [Candidatus Calescamantes bacterium]